MTKIIILLIVAFMLSVRLIAQNASEAPKVKFGKVSMEELAMKSYENDTTAEAVILYDEGSSDVKYEVDIYTKYNTGFILTYERFVRIKILKQGGVNWGNLNFSLYSFNSNREKMTSAVGTTFNLENGKIVKSELKRDAIFNERQNKYYETVSLAMPSVKIGSVIDLKYSIRTNMVWNLRTWHFQYTIPVKWSQYNVVYPEDFTYNHSSLGYYPLLYNKISNNPLTKSKKFDYAAKDVPAIKPEPYMTTMDNYTTLVKFELANTNFLTVGGGYKDYTTSWIDIAKQLSEDESFGMQLKTTGFIEDVVAGITKGITDDITKVGLLYNHVQHSMKWDGHKSIYTSQNLKKALSDKTGNCADINLLLTIILNKAGIIAYPVILSTRENGLLPLTNASISDCNYVIAQAIVNGKPVLLDATEPNLQTGLIPYRCLNGEGHLIGDVVSQPVSLSNPKSTENAMVQLEIKEGKMIGTIDKRLSGLSAFDFRESVKTAGGKQEQFDKLKNSSSELDYLDYKYNNLDSLSQPVSLAYKIALKDEPDNDAGLIYIDPILVNRHKNNPFTSPTRVYPVDFGVPFTEGYNLQLTIPEGYKADGLPESKSIMMEGKGAHFLYQISQLENKIVLNLRFSIDKAIFLPSEYQKLKDFYNIVINKQAEQIILKKTTI